jgi:hypothetical protein
MPEQATHESAIVPSGELTIVTDAADAAEQTELDESTAAKLLHILDVREGNKKAGEHDIIVLLDSWAYEDWSDYDIADNPALICGHVEDYSDDAYKVRGAFEALMGVMDPKSVEEVEEAWVTDLIKQVDETDEDFHDEKGEKFLPKSAVAGIVVYDN